VEAGVEIGDRCRLLSRAVIKSGTVLGSDNEVGEGAVLGGRPQHLHAGDQVGKLIIGNGNVFRENVTVHRGLTADVETRIGDHCFIMVNAHVAHDCRVGDRVILANNSMVAGHVEVEDRAYLSGAVAVHQFCRIGRLAMVGGQAHINQDVPPFVTVDGQSGLIVGLNVVGLQRAGLSAEDIQQLKSAYRVIYRSGLTWAETLEALVDQFPRGPASEFHPFLTSAQRGVTQERRTPRRATLALAAPPVQTDRTEPARRAG